MVLSAFRAGFFEILRTHAIPFNGKIILYVNHHKEERKL